MELLRRFGRAVWGALCAAGRFLGWLLGGLFGRMQWQAPGWLKWTGAKGLAAGRVVKAHPGRSAALTATALALIAGGWFGYRWYESRPKPYQPPLITFEVHAPERTAYDDTPITVHPLTIDFSGSVAPIALVGKNVEQGIRLEPPLEGKWRWETDQQLKFEPQGDWPVGQKFHVRFEQKLAFAEHVRLSAHALDFDSAPFEASLANSEFYQNPQDPTQKKAVFDLGFGHPVDPAEFERRIKLVMELENHKTVEPKFVVSYDEKKLHGYVHSEPLPMPNADTKITLTVAAGVRAARGGPATAEPVTGEVAIPGRYSLEVATVSAALADNARYEPDQVLVLSMSEAVNEKDMAQATSAWVLPKFNPKTPEAERTEPYDWSTDPNIGEAILKQAQKLALEPVPAEREFFQVQSYKHHAEPGQYLYVKVAKGLKSFGGYVLGKAMTKVVEVPDYPKILRFMSQGSLLPLNGERRVSVVARNVPGMKVEIARVLPDQLQHLVSLNYGSYTEPRLSGIGPDDITERYEQTSTFEAEPGKAHYEGIDLGKYLGPQGVGKRGVFLLKIESYKPKEEAAAAPAADESENSEGEGEAEAPAESEPEVPVRDSRLIVVTDLGVVVKKSLDGSQDVFVESLNGGTPVADAEVEVVARNGQTLLKQNTDRDGRVHFATLKSFERERTPSMYLVRRGEDVSFLPVAGRDRRLDFSRFDIGGERNAKDAGKLNAYLFSDRGMYRPGDSFHVGMIVRAADWAKPLDGIPLEAEIVDARGLPVSRQKLRLDQAGFQELSYTTSEAAPTGAWNVNLYLVKDGQSDVMLGSVTLQVKEFLPDRMKLSAHLSSEVSEGWVKPGQLAGRVLLQNLFGTPAQERRIEGTLILSPTVPSFRSYPDFRFTDPLRTKDGYSTPLGEGKTDAKGEAEFPLGLEKYGSATFQLNFLARGFEAEGGRSVAGAVRTLVSSLDYLVGIKTDGDLDYIKRGAARKIKVIAIDPSARKIAQSELKAQLIEHKYVSVLTKQDSGVYKYESRAKDVPVSEQPVAIPAEGLEYQLPTDAPGNFALVLRNAKGEELNRIDYAVSGEANLARSLERNAELQLSLSKHDYAPGEEIEIAVRAPYTGSGLITIERDQVYAHVWFKTKTTSSVQKIKVPAGFEGNGYVNVQFLRDPGSDEIYMSPLSYGVAAFSVDRDARRDKLTLSVPDKIKPGETLVMKLKAAEPARVALFAVDEGILQVARYKLGDPLDLFFQKRMLEVETNQILDLVLPEFSKLIAMAAAPGGDADSLIARHLNPFKKKHQEPVAYWSGIVEVKGEREFRYQVPDYFNGKVRVMVVAVTPARIGITESGTLVRGDFVLSPNAPAMVAPGDEFEVSVGVANNLEGQKPGEMPVAVELASEAGLEVVGAAKQELKLAPQREGSARFRLRAREALGPAKLTFKVSTGEYGAKQSAEVSVRPAVPYRSSVTFGSLAQTKVDLKTGPALYDEHAKRTLAAAYTPLVLAQGLSAYLGDYPHRCTEQLISQGYPALVFSTRPEFGAVQADAAGKADPFAALFDEMHARQNGEGGFGAWSATPTADRFVSAYAIQFLLEARERGRAVPADMLALGNGYLQQLAADESDSSMAGLRERAFAVYLLTRQGNVTSNALAAVEKRLDERFAKTWRDDVTAAYLGAALKLMREDKEAARLVAGPEKILVRHAEERGYTIERYFDPLLSDAVTLYLVSKHFPDRAKALPAEALTNLVHPLQRGWFNTITSATTILALDGYAGSTAPAGVGTLALAEVGKDGAAKPFGAAQGQVMRGGFGGAVPTLRIGNELGSSAWYSLTQAGFARAVPTDEVKQGFELQREYRDAGGKAVTSVALGDELDVHLRVRATRPDGVNSVALVDLLPGGFEPVLEPPPNPDDAANAPTAPVAPVFGSPKSTWRPDFADVRDDRVVVYGFIGPDLKEFIYRIKATNAGTFQIPPAYGEGMYDRTIEARSGGGRMTVERKEGAK